MTKVIGKYDFCVEKRSLCAGNNEKAFFCFFYLPYLKGIRETREKIFVLFVILIWKLIE